MYILVLYMALLSGLLGMVRSFDTSPALNRIRTSLVREVGNVGVGMSMSAATTDARGDRIKRPKGMNDKFNWEKQVRLTATHSRGTNDCSQQAFVVGSLVTLCTHFVIFFVREDCYVG